MRQDTLRRLEAALDAVQADLSGRVEELARKSTAGTLSEDERNEYEQIVRLNDLLSVAKLQAQQFWLPRTA